MVEESVGGADFSGDVLLGDVGAGFEFRDEELGVLVGVELVVSGAAPVGFIFDDEGVADLLDGIAEGGFVGEGDGERGGDL